MADLTRQRVSAEGVIDVLRGASGVADVVPVEAGWTGQGYGFKSDLSFGEADLEDVLYIPEYGWSEPQSGGKCDFYTKKAFLKLVGAAPESPRENELSAAEALYDEADWQYPETLLDEWLEYGIAGFCPDHGIVTPEDEDEPICPVCGKELED